MNNTSCGRPRAEKYTPIKNTTSRRANVSQTLHIHYISNAYYTLTSLICTLYPLSPLAHDIPWDLWRNKRGPRSPHAKLIWKKKNPGSNLHAQMRNIMKHEKHNNILGSYIKRCSITGNPHTRSVIDEARQREPKSPRYEISQSGGSVIILITTFDTPQHKTWELRVCN